MKQIILLFLVLSAWNFHAQNNRLVKIKILKEDSTLEVNGTDSSYIYNAYVVSTNANVITGVDLEFRNKSDSSWVTAKDSSYNWSQISNKMHNNIQFKMCKPNNNTFKLCLGRFYYSVRHKFTIAVSSTNGSLTKEFDF
jgi:hypothetical protein